MIMKDELVTTFFKPLHQQIPRETEETHESGLTERSYSRSISESRIY